MTLRGPCGPKNAAQSNSSIVKTISFQVRPNPYGLCFPAVQPFWCLLGHLLYRGLWPGQKYILYVHIVKWSVHAFSGFINQSHMFEFQLVLAGAFAGWYWTFDKKKSLPINGDIALSLMMMVKLFCAARPIERK